MTEALQTTENEGDRVFDPNVGFQGGERRQKRQLGSNIRDLLGGSVGDARSGFAPDSPIGSLVEGFDVEGAARQAKGLTSDIFGDRGPSERLTGLTDTSFTDLEEKRRRREEEGLGGLFG